MASIRSITYTPDSIERRPKDRFARVAVQSVNLVAGYGIAGDRKGGHPRRQINILGQTTLDTLTNRGVDTAPGAMGEQMVIAGIDVDNLTPGTRLTFGAKAEVEVTELRGGCIRLEQIQDGDSALFDGRLGVLVRVLVGGDVFVGDEVIVHTPIKEVDYV